MALLFCLLSRVVWAQSWNPKKTWVFAVGCVKFKDKKTYSCFPTKDRSDAKFIKALEARGVPSDQVLYLKDKEADKDTIESSFRKFVRKPGPQDTLIIYYTGHGSPGAGHQAYFTPYDGTDKNSSLWKISTIFITLDKSFSGARVLFAIDCCYSGYVSKAVRRRKSGKPYAALTSSNARSVSTGEWTFTDALIDGITGNPVVDRDRNGSITFKELSQYVEDEMVFAEEQLSSMATSEGFSGDLVLSRREGPSVVGRVGQRFEARDEGEWYRARVLAEKGDKVKVHFYGYPSSKDDWVAVKDLRALKLPAYQEGARVQIEEDGQWYPGKIRKAHRGVYLVHYKDYDEDEDEWVGSDRLKR